MSYYNVLVISVYIYYTHNLHRNISIYKHNYTIQILINVHLYYDNNVTLDNQNKMLYKSNWKWRNELGGNVLTYINGIQNGLSIMKYPN